jgi:hypothetical protein
MKFDDIFFWGVVVVSFTAVILSGVAIVVEWVL